MSHGYKYAGLIGLAGFVKKALTLRRLAVWGALAVFLAAIVWSAFLLALGLGLNQTAQRGAATLGLTIAGIKGTLGRYRTLPQLIADNKDVRAILTSQNPSSISTQVNRELKRLNDIVGASDTYVLNNSGLTVAASNFDTDTSFVGKNFSYRPYFQDAIGGKLGKYFAIGTTSKKRGYYFASAVKVDGKTVGVVTVKIAIDKMESAWQSRDHEIVVTDENGIIFMSSNPRWLFQSIKPLSPAVLKQLQKTRKYNGADLKELVLKRSVRTTPLFEILTMQSAHQSAEYVVQSTPMSEQAWNVQIFSSTSPARTQAYIIAATVLFVLLSILLAGAFFIQRRQRLLERMQAQQQAQLELEKQVQLRTFDLNQANISLKDEIKERKATENKLRQTQADLVQAGKLAALGQMSAALSHELNQPLGAIKSYADNAGAYLQRGREKEAGENVSRISTLVDRMASISKNLRNFARKPNEEISVIPVAQIVNDAVEILERKLSDAKTEIQIQLPEHELWAKGGQVRLQQVIVNLISNGIDAMEDSQNAKIEINAHQNDDVITIDVRDYGQGISPEHAAKIFDPFFSTKGVGKGLGLGLSISYNIIKDFGGQLSTYAHRDGGTVFSIQLEAGNPLEQQAVQ